MKESIRFHVQMVLHKILNPILMPLGLYVSWLDYFTTLEEESYAYSELQERALIDRLRLLQLKAEQIGYSVHWTEGAKTFTLVAQDDSVDFPQTLEEIDHALEIVRHDAQVAAKSEVQ